MTIETTVELETFNIAQSNTQGEVLDFILELDEDVADNYFTLAAIEGLMDKIVCQAPEEGELANLRDKFLAVARGK